MANTDGEFDFRYSRFDGQFMVCGNMGYTSLRVKGIDDNFRSALAETYWRYESSHRPLFRLENDNPKELSQINGVVALIYNADFDGPLGLKLNEDWQTQGEGRYCGLYQTAKPTVMDWKLGPKYPALKLDVDVNPLAHLGAREGVPHTMDEPLVTKASNLKIILVGFASQANFPICPNLQKIYDFEEYSEYISIDLKGFTTFSYIDNEGGKEERIKVPLSKRESRIPKAEQVDDGVRDK